MPLKEVSPLAQLIAARMAGQLEGVRNLPQYSGALSKVNLPAAYAGDQRSLQATQRAMNLAETGIESEGRRKFIKQAAATAARSAIPDSVANALGTGIVKKALTDAVSPQIPDESIQSAIWASLSGAMRKYSGRRDGALRHEDILDMLESRFTERIAGDGGPAPEGWLAHEVRAADVDRAAGYPDGTTAEYLKRRGFYSPEKAELLDTLAEEQVNAYNHIDNPHDLADWVADPTMIQESHLPVHGSKADAMQYHGVSSDGELIQALGDEAASNAIYSNLSPGEWAGEASKDLFFTPNHEAAVQEVRDLLDDDAIYQLGNRIFKTLK